MAYRTGDFGDFVKEVLVSAAKGGVEYLKQKPKDEKKPEDKKPTTEQPKSALDKLVANAADAAADAKAKATRDVIMWLVIGYLVLQES